LEVVGVLVKEDAGGMNSRFGLGGRTTGGVTLAGVKPN